MRIFHSYKDAWYDAPFAKDEKVGLCWYLVRKTAVENSFAKTFDDQRRLLGPENEVPRACELTYTVVLYFMTTGERLFEGNGVRCIDLAPDGSRAWVGHFDCNGLQIFTQDDNEHSEHSHLGLSSVRK